MKNVPLQTTTELAKCIRDGCDKAHKDRCLLSPQRQDYNAAIAR